MRIQFLLLTLASLRGESILSQGTLLDAGYRQMYNLQFDAAHQTFHEWEREHPDDPMGPVSDAAAYVFSEFERLHVLEIEFFMDDSNFLTRQKLKADPAVKRSLDAALARSEELANRILAREPQDHNAIFAKVLRFGLNADYLALVEKKNLAALSDVKSSRLLAEKLVAADPSFSDAYLAIGVENYLLSLKPAPVRWFLRVRGAQTDKELGIEKLSVTAERGHYLLPYARVLLAVAAIRDKNLGRARELLTDLAREFPYNRLYAQQLARLR
jgi:hypothetical protein